MRFVLEARHWVIMIGAVILATAAMILAPQAVAIYPVTTYAVPIIAVAAILDTLGTAAERLRWPLKLLAWVFLCAAALTALWPLRSPLSDMSATIQAWTGQGWPLPRSIWEGLKGLARYSDPQKQAMAISFALGACGVAIAVSTPLMAIFNPRIGRNRKSRTGPWQAGWMDPRDIAQLKRNKTGLPLALHKGKLLRYVKNDAKGWRGGHHLVVSGTRGGKGVSAVIPAILDHQGPVVVLDIKG
ncbi:type IV secretion system protein VirD4, partial [Salipiger aestuarii]